MPSSSSRNNKIICKYIYLYILLDIDRIIEYPWIYLNIESYDARNGEEKRKYRQTKSFDSLIERIHLRDTYLYIKTHLSIFGHIFILKNYVDCM